MYITFLYLVYSHPKLTNHNPKLKSFMNVASVFLWTLIYISPKFKSVWYQHMNFRKSIHYNNYFVVITYCITWLKQHQTFTVALSLCETLTIQHYLIFLTTQNASKLLISHVHTPLIVIIFIFISKFCLLNGLNKFSKCSLNWSVFGFSTLSLSSFPLQWVDFHINILSLALKCGIQMWCALSQECAARWWCVVKWAPVSILTRHGSLHWAWLTHTFICYPYTCLQVSRPAMLPPTLVCTSVIS